jgi:hypothetical protein
MFAASFEESKGKGEVHMDKEPIKDYLRRFKARPLRYFTTRGPRGFPCKVQVHASEETGINIQHP